MPLDPEILFGFFEQHPERPWHVQDIQKQLKVANDDRADLRRILADLAEEGRLVRTRRRTYGLPEEMNLTAGRLQVTAGGYGFVIPDEGGKDLFIPADGLAGAWNGDRVLARANPLRSDNGRTAGEVVRVVTRKNTMVVGTLEYARGYAILRPDSPRLRERILLLPDSVGKLDAGIRVVGRMIWPEDSGERDPFAEVAEVLGDGDDPEIETRAVIVQYDLKDAFDPETVAEAAAVPPTVSGEMMAGRTDIRQISTFTVDGADAKDFDDAISLERLKGRGKDGLVRVGVHIADVSYYVAEGTSLDREARERGTSVYLPGQVLPMLPEELSNGICSLVEGQPRLALSVFVDVTRGGEVKAVRFRETVIESDARLTYGDVQDFADGGRLPKGKRKLERDVKLLINLTQELRTARIGGGALDFQLSEAKVDVDDEGALHINPIRSNEARQLIEELMLLANRLVAEDLDRRDVPALYRVHEDPSEDKIEALQRGLGRLGYTIDLEKATPQDLQNVIVQAAGKPESQLVNTLLLRSLKQARYSPDNLGHFGLAFDHYLHFTSPIRRYPDLVVHRVLRAGMQHRLSPTLKERLKSDFPKLAEHTSERERNAEQAERDLTRYYHARWARDHLGEALTGHVSGVTNFGVFVALPNGVEGLMHVSHLDDDYYIFLEDSLTLMGKHKRRSFRMGDRVDVRIFQANPTIRQIDLVPADLAMPEVEAEEPVKSQRAPKRLKNPIGADRDESEDRPEVRPERKSDGGPDGRSESRGGGRRGRGGGRDERSGRAKAKDDGGGRGGRRTGGERKAPERRPARAATGRRRVLVFGDPDRRR